MDKVFVGLSGGVDSAVSAALLKEQGYDVTGVFIKIWTPEFLECTWREDRLDAKRVAAHLEIPFLEIDLSQEYLDAVVKDMVENYKKGFTPNPDVLCNRVIKFGAFSKWAFENGAAYVATGHYARIEKQGEFLKLLKGADPAKDQSYFLYSLTSHDLARVVFPVGGFSKKEIRAKAEAYGLPNAARPDSQGLCFVGDVPMQEFLGRFISLTPGKLLGEGGTILGTHDGAALFTIGQRHGFRLASSAPAGPYYVVAVDAAANTVTVSKTKQDTMHRNAALTDVHWINESVSVVDAVARYHGAPVRAEISGSLDAYRVEFVEPLQLTRGQSLVFYKGDECLGGGIIQSVS
jgi:tRNA-specific 2-thiouridylase